MKRIIAVSCMLFLLLFCGTVKLNTAQVLAQAGMQPESPQPEIQPAQPVEGGGPGFTLPAQPIPHHRVGQPARSASATAQVQRKNAQGETETVSLTGITALMAEGVMSDPLQGNYNIVKRDKILFSDYKYLTTPVFDTQTFAYQSSTPPARTSFVGAKAFGNDRVSAIAAGDLEGDLIDEQIVAYVEPSNKHFMLSIGGIHGLVGTLLSAPAAVGHPSGAMDVVARGYDDALWSIHYSGSAWGTWNNNAGFRMLSAPAAATRAEGMMDVFAVGVDNQLYFSKWNGATWSSWTAISGGTLFPATTAELPLQAVPGAAAVASNSTRLDVFRVAPDHTLYQISSDDGGSTWGSWASLGGMLASAPAAAFSNNRMIVTAMGMDGALWYRIYSGSAWGSWQRLDVPAELAANPTPAAGGGADGYLEIFLPGKDNHVYSNVYFGTTWGGWGDQLMEGIEHTPTVGAGVGAASLTTGPRVFVTATSGAIYTPGTPLWVVLPKPSATLVFDTGLSTTSAFGDLDIENGILDVTTGYFSGDGRQQIVMGYLEANAVVKVAVFDIHDGFRLTKVAGLTAGVTNGGYFPRVAAGDVDGDGLDEIGLTYRISTEDHICHLRVYNVDKTGGAWAGTLSEIGTARHMDFDGGAHWFAATLDVQAGDVVPEAGSPNDEFVVLADWVESISGDDRSLGVTLTLFDNDPPTPADGWKRILTYHENSSDLLPWNEGAASGAALAIGDLNGPQPGYGLDEIALVWPGGFDHGDWPDIYEDIYIESYKADTKALVQVGYRDLPGWSRYTFLDRIAIGDLDMDMQNEVVYVGHEGGKYGDTGYYMYIYEATVTPGTGAVTLANPTASTLFYASPPRAFDLALGDFTGSGLKVGPPSYRVQNKMTTPVIFLNLPPMHQDIIKVGGVDTVVKAVNGAYATHTVETGQTSVYASESKREWSLSTGFEMGAGGGGHKVTTSFDNTYGENFSNSEENITSYSVTDVNTADKLDKVVHNETHYAIYEYPVYGLVDGDGSVPRTISVVWPLLDVPLQTNVPASTDSNRCDEAFYAAGHQIYNAWSYDDNTGTPRFKDWDIGILAKSTTGGTQTKLRMGENTSVSKSSSFKDQISAGLEYSYENELKIPLIGKAFDFSFRAYAKGTYGMEEISTFKSTYNNESEVVVDYPSAANMPSIRAYMYWAKGGYLVVDYQSRPDPLQQPWSYYDKPDPAFILPWYGFPDPAAPVAPLCGTARQYFSHDIVIEPAKASIGETVKITATVRNFSDEDIPAPVQVKFYQGDPDSGGTYLGQMCEIAAFGRTAGAQSCFINWTVNGTPGESKIFAVIDPNNTIPHEMHQTGDLINNNKAYGLLKIAGGDYFDPGLKQQQAYQPVAYQQAIGLRFDLYLPTNNLTRIEHPGQPDTYESQSLLVELVPTSAGSVVSVGKPFKLQVTFNDDLQTDFAFFRMAPLLPPPAPLQPVPSPLGLMVQYRDEDLMPGKQKSDLALYRQNGARWEVANCPGYAAVRFDDQNRIAVPICRTGTFILAQQNLDPKKVFLPAISK